MQTCSKSLMICTHLSSNYKQKWFNNNLLKHMLPSSINPTKSNSHTINSIIINPFRTLPTLISSTDLNMDKAGTTVTGSESTMVHLITPSITAGPMGIVTILDWIARPNCKGIKMLRLFKTKLEEAQEVANDG
eukprot:632567-Ditylum_brightwellii.AAC.1